MKPLGKENLTLPIRPEDVPEREWLDRKFRTLSLRETAIVESLLIRSLRGIRQRARYVGMPVNSFKHHLKDLYFYFGIDKSRFVPMSRLTYYAALWKGLL